jgi:hypothetical protein
MRTGERFLTGFHPSVWAQEGQVGVMGLPLPPVRNREVIYNPLFAAMGCVPQVGPPLLAPGGGAVAGGCHEMGIFRPGQT